MWEIVITIIVKIIIKNNFMTPSRTRHRLVTFKHMDLIHNKMQRKKNLCCFRARCVTVKIVCQKSTLFTELIELIDEIKIFKHCNEFSKKKKISRKIFRSNYFFFLNLSLNFNFFRCSCTEFNWIGKMRCFQQIWTKIRRLRFTTQKCFLSYKWAQLR